MTTMTLKRAVCAVSRKIQDDVVRVWGVENREENFLTALRQTFGFHVFFVDIKASTAVAMKSSGISRYVVQ
jgi:hypothetical protein